MAGMVDITKSLAQLRRDGLCFTNEERPAQNFVKINGFVNFDPEEVAKKIVRGEEITVTQYKTRWQGRPRLLEVCHDPSVTEIVDQRLLRGLRAYLQWWQYTGESIARD